MTLLNFNSKYVVQSTSLLSLSSTSLVDDPYAIQSFTLLIPQTVLVVYATSDSWQTTGARGAHTAINIDGSDHANSHDTGYCQPISGYRNMSCWVGILTAGPHTIKGRAAETPGVAGRVSRRVLLVYVFNGDEFVYIDDSTAQTFTSVSMVGDPNAQITFTPSGSCPVLIMYNASGIRPATQPIRGFEVAINVNGTDYAQAGDSIYTTNSSLSIFTCYMTTLAAVPNTIQGRFLSPDGTTATVSTRQLVILPLDTSTLVDIAISNTPLSFGYPVGLIADPESLITRVTHESRELLVVCMATKYDGVTGSSQYDFRYQIQLDSNPQGYGGYTNMNYPASTQSQAAAQVFATTVAKGAHTVQGELIAYDTTKGAVISSRSFIALWFGQSKPPAGGSTAPKLVASKLI